MKKMWIAQVVGMIAGTYALWESRHDIPRHIAALIFVLLLMTTFTLALEVMITRATTPGGSS